MGQRFNGLLMDNCVSLQVWIHVTQKIIASMFVSNMVILIFANVMKDMC